MVLQIPRDRQTPHITWEPLPEDFILPDDPVENLQQPNLAAALTDALGAASRIQPQMLIASNFGLVATVDQKTIVKAPDWLYVPQVHPVPERLIRRSYTPFLEGSPVAVVMEFLSETDAGEYSVRPTFPYGKLHFYEQILKVPTYAIFDPYRSALEVRHLQANTYTFLEPSAEGRYWIPELELFLGIWFGTRLGITAPWLRWWDSDGQILLWSSERAEQEHQRAEQERQRAEQQQQKAERLAARLRELGIDPETLG